MGRHLGIDFLRISIVFGTQVGTEIARKIEPRHAKTRQDRGREGKGEERKREAGIGKEKVPGGDSPPGWGQGSPTL